MLAPKRTKYRKQMRGRLKGFARSDTRSGARIAFGDFALQATERGWVTAREIEAGRMAIQRHVKRAGRLYIRIFPDKPVTKKPLEVRMGTGKGNVEYWVAVVRPGRILFEMEGVPEPLAREALRLASHKLSVATQIRMRGDAP
ncbi:MAG: 50S ribosomal protein L16 [Myxococcota bacterium]|nr:50S ribosomal protein L16 [Myxococcota bacterium]MDW8363242.1 50S ribosomal protein L16 [Myxococcales bacterium]